MRARAARRGVADLVTPTGLTVRHLERQGYRVDIVERRISRKLARDLFGCIDVLAIRRDETLAVQVTDVSNQAKRVRKVTDSPALADMREAGWRIEVHGWRPNGTLRVVDLS